MDVPVQSRHGRRARCIQLNRTSGVHRACRRAGLPRRARAKPFPFGKSGVSDVFEILPELAILTSDILGPESSTTLVEKSALVEKSQKSLPVTRRQPRPAVKDGQNLGEG
jgi:hypothetical protein